MQGKTTNDGFTLIEILVVIVIIGVTISFALMSFGDFGKTRKIRIAAEEFTQFLAFVHDRALLESSTLKVQLTSAGYGVQRMGPNQHWQSLRSSFYRTHTLPPKTVIVVAHGSPKADKLVVILNGTGDMTAFKIYFGTKETPHLASVMGEENGNLIFNKEAN